MRVVMFYHSLISDWNHGNAHFLRGVVSELISRGHDVCVYEPKDAWSMQNLLLDCGPDAVEMFRRAYPALASIQYNPADINLDKALDGADLVIVHEWNSHDLVKNIGEHRSRVGGYKLLFHDTHHRSVTDSDSMAAYDLTHYDGVLAFGNVIRDIYLSNGWVSRAWTWHEAADTRVFKPADDAEPEADLVWVGNWGDGERTAEINEFLIEPVWELSFNAKIYGVRYPQAAISKLSKAGIKYGGWLPNFHVPEVFKSYKMTVHIPRGPYVQALPGIPTIRVFEALACGIPLICAPWKDAEGLFTPGKDYLVAHNGAQMKQYMDALLNDQDMANELSQHGLNTILSRHTCVHRVDELLNIYESLEAETC